MAAELYRLQVAKKRGGDVELFESRERFEAALLEALLDVEAEKAHGWRLRVIRQWQRASGHRKDDDPVVTRVISTQQLIDGEWVDLHATVLPPRLEFS